MNEWGKERTGRESNYLFKKTKNKKKQNKTKIKQNKTKQNKRKTGKKNELIQNEIWRIKSHEQWMRENKNWKRKK